MHHDCRRRMSFNHLAEIVGVLVGNAIGLHPLLALQCSSSAMSGGVGTASAFGAIFEEWGAPNATTIGVAAGTCGNIMGSLIGGPVAAFLITRHKLKADPMTSRVRKDRRSNPLKQQPHDFHVCHVSAGCRSRNADLLYP